ncbi:MAG: translation initiation factor IF-2 [Bacteroidota bacterium]|nr:translation initiation factor IF-2 [Bacteroidota bacterium]
MASTRLSKIIKELNISLDRAVEFLAEKGHEVVRNPNTKIDDEQHDLLLGAFAADKSKKEASEQVSLLKREEKEMIKAEKEALRKDVPKATQETEDEAESPVAEEKTEETPVAAQEEAPKVKEEKVEKEPVAEPEEPKTEEVVEEKAPVAKEEPQPVEEKEKEEDSGVIKGRAQKVSGLKIQGKIDLDDAKKKKLAKEEAEKAKAEEEKVQAEAKKKAEEEAKAKEKAEKEKAEKESKKTDEKKEEKAEEPKPEAKEEPAKEDKPDDGRIETKFVKLQGPRLTGEKIDLSKFEKPKKKVASSSEKPDEGGRKRKRKRIRPDGPGGQQGGPGKKGKPATKGRGRDPKPELTEEEIQKQIKETLEKLTGSKKSKSSKLRREKRIERRDQEAMDEMMREEDKKTLKLTEFVTVTDLANMMDTPVNKIIASLMGLGMMVTMNQRLDAETLEMVAEEFGYKVDFVDSEITETLETAEDSEEDLEPRAPIVTVMGHVDHGKTSLLDYVRKANVIAGEAGGITQHIGAYSVQLEGGQRIAFLDTPGHEAFTAMRARGAQVTDVAIIVVAADDAVMPQTKEAISHAQAAGVPIVFALNKVDKAGANPDKIREQLAGMNLLVEDWGGKIQSQEISAKTGDGVQELLEKVLLEAEILELKANPKRNASGTIIEASLDKGRGYVSTILVQNGTLKVGDYILAGQYSGKVRALLDERGHRVNEAGPSTPVSMLGLDGAPQAGDTFQGMDDEREAKQIASKRQQLQREQSVRSQKNLTLEEIGRRLAVGDFQELNIILKGDVDGSIEALSDSLQKLSTDSIQVKIVHKAVGQITDSDILLAAASDAIVVGFQVRPSASARKLAEKEHVDIRLYSIIYDAINEIRDAMEGMLSPDLKEEVVGSAEIRETFKISKVGTIAGCMVIDGTINRNNRVRVIRDGVVIYTGELGSLKRFKDDVKEVQKGYECGLNIQNFNDIKVGDIVEAFQEVEIKKTLD